jgi:hypothetical protein
MNYTNQEILLLYSISKKNKEDVIQKLKFYVENINNYKERIKKAQKKLDKADNKYIKLCENYFNHNIYDKQDAEYNMDICELKLLKITNEMNFYISKIPSKNIILDDIRRVTEDYKYYKSIYNNQFF